MEEVDLPQLQLQLLLQQDIHMEKLVLITMMDYVEILVKTVDGVGHLMIHQHGHLKMLIVDAKQHLYKNSYLIDRIIKFY